MLRCPSGMQTIGIIGVYILGLYIGIMEEKIETTLLMMFSPWDQRSSWSPQATIL